MIICENGINREMTSEEIELYALQNDESEVSALEEFFEGLASSDTNSIAKIRTLARAFLNSSGGETQN